MQSIATTAAFCGFDLSQHLSPILSTQMKPSHFSGFDRDALFIAARDPEIEANSRDAQTSNRSYYRSYQSSDIPTSSRSRQTFYPSPLTQHPTKAMMCYQLLLLALVAIVPGFVESSLPG
jgi:hypothetical protein